MSDVEVKREKTLSRDEAAQRLAALAAALEVELEVELKWSNGKPARSTAAAPARRTTRASRRPRGTTK